jgi:hypothetical protein
VGRCGDNTLIGSKKEVTLFPDHSKQHNKALGEKVVLALIRNNFQASYHHDRFEAMAEIQDEISPGSTVGASGSMTIRELGLLESLLLKGCRILDHNSPGSTEKRLTNCRQTT